MQGKISLHARLSRNPDFSRQVPLNEPYPMVLPSGPANLGSLPVTPPTLNEFCSNLFGTTIGDTSRVDYNCKKVTKKMFVKMLSRMEFLVL